MTRIDGVFVESSKFKISSRAGLKSTWPNVSHLLTVIDPTRRLTWEIGELLSGSLTATEVEVNILLFPPNFRFFALPCEVRFLCFFGDLPAS
jgi:hypothetical protein